MAQQGVALGGAALGMMIGGPVGGQIGFAIGSVAGQMLFPSKGPKAEKQDLSVQAASYGTSIAILNGGDRTAGTMLWVKENEIQRKKVKTGGKGMGGAAGPATYEYFFTGAVLIGEGPIDGILQIYCDTKLEHDASAQALDDALANGGQFVTNLHAIDTDLRIYLGTEDQLPDPAMQADVGVDNCSAYRGLAYVIFDELPLKDFANRIPNFSFVYVKDGSLVYRNIDLTASAPGGTGADSAFPSSTFDAFAPYLWNVSSAGNVTKFDLASGTTALQVNVEDQLDSNDDPIAIGPGIAAADEAGHVFLPHGLTNFSDILVYRFDSETLSYQTHIPAIDSHFIGNWVYRSFVSGSSRWLIGLSSTGLLYVVDALTFELAAEPIATGADGAAWNDMVDMSPDKELWVTLNATSHLKRYALESSGGAGSYTWVLSLVSDIDLSGTFTGLDHVHYYADESVVLLGGEGVIGKLDPTSETITATATSVGVDENQLEWAKGPVNGRIWGQLTGADGAFVELDLASMEVVRSIVPSTWASSGGTKIKVGYNRWADALITPEAGFGGIRMLFLPRLDALDVDRADVLSDYATRAGLTTGQLDLTRVVDTVQGNTLRRQVTGRDASEPIMQSGFVDTVDVDGQVRYVPRGQSVTLTVPEDDLGAALWGEGDETQKLIEVLPQELNLPERVLIRHSDRDAQYDVGAAAAKRSREIIRSREQMTFDTAEVMSSTTARRLAERLLYTMWAEKPVKFSLPPKYRKLIPTDVINVVAHGATFRVRIEKINDGPYLECDGMIEEAATYLSDAPGAPSNIPSQVLQLLSPTQLFLIDSNLIRDEDDDRGHYLGIAPTVPDGLWSGAQIFKSSDAVSFAPSTSFVDAVEWGSATTALADHHCTTTDRYNTLTVKMVNGELESVTEAEMIDGANAFLLQSGEDWEFIQAASITDLSDGFYELATMLRGRRGTEQQAGGHAAGDRLIVLSTATMQRLTADSEVDQERYYKATTFGALFTPTGAVPFTNTARGKDCYAPEHVKATRDGSNNITFTWSRRSRLGDELDWNDSTLVPLGEDSEAYEVYIPGAVPPRTIAVSSETAAYSAADQTSDGLTPGDPVTGSVYQMSAINGRGRPASFTL